MTHPHISYPDPNYPVQLFSYHSSGIDRIPVHCHWHEDLELLFVESGTCFIQVDDQNLLLQADQGLFLNRNVLHALHSARPGFTFRLAALRFLPDIIFPHPEGNFAEQYLSPILSAPRLHYLILDKENNETADMLLLLKQLLPAVRSQAPGHELDVGAMLYKFWKYLVSFYAREQSQEPRHLSHYDNQRIRLALDYINEHFSESVTLEDIAGAIHTSNSECCRCFKRVLGVTPFEYLLKLRVLKAAALLQTEKAAMGNISDLAASVGFNSPSYFNKKFKQYLHCTPREYRSNCLQDS